MLWQTVKTLLLKQNRLSYCRLQATVHKLVTSSLCSTGCVKFGKSLMLVENDFTAALFTSTQLRHIQHSAVCSRTHRTLKKGRQDSEKERVLSHPKKINIEFEYFNDETVKGEENLNIDDDIEMEKCHHYSDTYPDGLKDLDKNLAENLYVMSDEKEDEINKGMLIPLGNKKISRLKKAVHTSSVQSETCYKPRSITEELLDEETGTVNAVVVHSKETKDLAEVDVEQGLALAEKGELDLKNVKKVEFPALTNFSPVVNDTEVLRELVKLGVDLSEIQKKGMADHVLQMDFKKDVSGYILFLKDCGVPGDSIGRAITRCPWIFQHSVHNLRVRIDYLRSKKFDKATVANMIDKDPKFLCIPVERIDVKLGFLQKEFQLTGDQIREKVGGLSKLIYHPQHLISRRKFYLKRILGFTEVELKTMFLTYPKVFLYSSEYIAHKFDYLHNVMELPHDIIAKTPQTLNTTHHKLESRHRFLVKCRRAQYDPTKENYVSLMALITGDDETWCFEVAKSSVADYNEFLKCI